MHAAIRRTIRPGAVLALLGLAALVAWALWPSAPPPPPARDAGGFELSELLGSSQGEIGTRGPRTDAATGYARALAPRPFVFPDDHGAHPEFRSEWWYFTGNLEDASGRRFGYQWVIFRQALAPRGEPRASAWGTNQAYMAHFALTDVESGDFQAHERFARGAAGLAGARATPLRIWLEDWSLEEEAAGVWRLRAAAGDARIDLALRPAKPPVPNGEHGLSRKSAAPGNASHYYSIPRLSTSGRVFIDGKPHTVSGLSWLDREWGTSALAGDQQGWDWFALQLSDGSDLMLYRLRHADGSVDPFSAGSFIAPDGAHSPLTAAAFELETLEHWTSPRGTRYPSRWRLRVPAHGLTLDVRPVLPDQELDLSVRYWEGAVDVTGSHGGDAVTGRGYVELVGYRARGFGRGSP